MYVYSKHMATWRINFKHANQQTVHQSQIRKEETTKETREFGLKKPDSSQSKILFSLLRENLQEIYSSDIFPVFVRKVTEIKFLVAFSQSQTVQTNQTNLLPPL